MGMIRALAADPQECQIPLQPSQKNIISKNWITRFLNRHPILVTKFASRIDCQRTYTGNSCILQDHLRKLGKDITERKIKPNAITNVDEKGVVMGILPHTKVVTRRGGGIHALLRAVSANILPNSKLYHQMALSFPLT
jgi:hypothetical protein